MPSDKNSIIPAAVIIAATRNPVLNPVKAGLTPIIIREIRSPTQFTAVGPFLDLSL
jgi:hypothetical protein